MSLARDFLLRRGLQLMRWPPDRAERCVVLAAWMASERRWDILPWAVCVPGLSNVVVMEKPAPASYMSSSNISLMRLQKPPGLSLEA